MSREWLVVVLVGLLVGLGLVMGYYGYRAMLAGYPFTFKTVRYGLSANWYLGEIQPIFLRQESNGETNFLLVAYPTPQGWWTTAKVLVGGEYAGQKLPWVPFTQKEEVEASLIVGADFKYPFSLGQRIRVTYLVAQPGAQVDEFSEDCEKTPRLCQLAEIVLAEEAYGETVSDHGLLPSEPVMAVGVSSDLEVEPEEGGL